MQIVTKLIADLNVTRAKIEADAIDGTKLADDAVDSEHIASTAVDGDHLSTDAKMTVLDSKYQLALDTFTSFSAGSSTTAACTDKALTAATTRKFGGSSSVKGLITTAGDNKAFICKTTGGDKIQNASGEEVYGRITASTNALAGTSAFTLNSNQVAGTDTAYTSELSANDWIKLNSSGKYYKVASIESDIALTLASNYLEANGSGACSEGTVTLSYYTIHTGAETAHTMAGETIDVQIPESYSLYDIPFNALVSGQGFSEEFAGDHNHDDRYFTETELSKTTATTGASQIGVANAAVVGMSGTTVQSGLEQIARAGRYEAKTIAVEDVIPALTYTPREAASVVLVVGGVPQRYTTDYTVSGKTISWVYAGAGFHLAVADVVWVIYDSSD